METKNVFREAGAYALGVILSCGPSQIYGLIKGTIDLVKYAQIRSKISRWESLQNKLDKNEFERLKKDKTFTKLQNSKKYKDSEDFNVKTINKVYDLNEKKRLKTKSLKRDLVALIPFVGAIFAWRIGAGKAGAQWASTPGIEHSAAQALEDHNDKLSKIFYPLSSKVDQKVIETEDHISIPVSIRNGQLDAIFLQGKDADPKGPTVVICHGNGMTCDSMLPWGQWWQKQGYNVLMPTMGGYPGSTGIKTSEGSTYQDVEAIRKYLVSQEIKEVGFHGLSIGGSLAFQGAVGKSEAELKTLFVVADQTFTSAKDVVENFAENNITCAIPHLARGLGQAATPVRKIRLSSTLETETDGLSNIGKAQLMKDKNIPLITIKSSKDHLMGKKKVNGKYQDSFADDLLKARYGELKNDNLIELPGGHCACFANNDSATKKLKAFLQEVRNKKEK